MEERETYFLTTAIDYPNAAPHIGHSLEKVAADVVARFHRLMGHDTYFSMGLDENSQHVVTAAEKNGMVPREWVDVMDVAFRRAWQDLNISYDRWIRTSSEPIHFRASQELFRRAEAKGDIYKAQYAGWYCPNCNAFYSDAELVDGHCPEHPTLTPDWLEEENYFFALSHYGEALREHILTNPGFIVPESRKQEVLALIDQGLRDFSVSRLVRESGPAWGVPLPNDPQHVIYVWFDALTNYLTATGFPDDMAGYAHYWPANAHVIGKNITRFHCLYWPAMLLAADIALPRSVAVHGFMTLEGQKISKTTGNIIDPIDIVAEYGTDPVRYYLMRDVSFASDSNFSRVNLLRRYNDELVNDLGNLLNRVVSMVMRYRKGVVAPLAEGGAREAELRAVAAEARQQAETRIGRWELDAALGAIWNLVRRGNQYVEQSEPWKLAKSPEQAQQLDLVLASAAETLRLLSIYLAPFIPDACDRIAQQLGQEGVSAGSWAATGNWGDVAITQVQPGPVLFPRREVVEVTA